MVYANSTVGVRWQRLCARQRWSEVTNTGGTTTGLLDAPISLESLVDACLKYDKSRRYRHYNDSLDRFRAFVGVDIATPESQDNLDLSNEEHCEALINLFLNPWQCRQPNPILSPEPSDDEELVVRKTERNARLIAGLANWWDETREARHAIPNDLELSRATDVDLKWIAEPFADLTAIDAGDEAGYVQSFSNVPASKTLFVLRPRLFMAWDTAIKRECWIPQVGSAFHLLHFHEKARIKLQPLETEANGLERYVSEATGRSCTGTEALNKYLFIKSRKGAGESAQSALQA